MNREKYEIKLVYNESTDKINESFFNCEIDMTNEVLELAVGKLFNDMNYKPNGGQIT